MLSNTALSTPFETHAPRSHCNTRSNVVTGGKNNALITIHKLLFQPLIVMLQEQMGVMHRYLCNIVLHIAVLSVPKGLSCSATRPKIFNV